MSERFTRQLVKVLSFTFPRLRDLRATSTIKQSGMGKMFVEFEEVSSDFACYDLLYEREFMGQPVVICQAHSSVRQIVLFRILAIAKELITSAPRLAPSTL